MKIYIAGRYSRRTEFLEYANQLEAAGHIVTSRWIFGAHEIADRHGRVADNEVNHQDPAVWGEFNRRIAIEDFLDVQACEVLIQFPEPPRSHAGRGGYFVEQGLGLAWNKIVILVGPRINAFHYLDGVISVPNFSEALYKVTLLNSPGVTSA